MPKDFKRWHAEKETIDTQSGRPGFHEREIWSCRLGANVGFEQDGVGKDFLRPIVIVRKFNNEIFWGIPLTKTTKTGSYYFQFSFISGVQSAAIVSQVRLIDAKRLSHRIGHIASVDFSVLMQK